ncbi:hypothetical protein CTAYLR_004654 [Chrysophaeum taylorii]|uniref:DNA 3'-5' helicase n=1 Tax=Chrysophaeum taylorii TaxID=2483200 RepID=A0AAD7U7L0_9STRA|nr:hypothetical protein CTAYLR_004654 [Chrysophaeum taylorii]
MEPASKRSKKTISSSSSDNNNNNNKSSPREEIVGPLNAEQKAVAVWRPKSWAERARGVRVRVIAHAGTGKTLTLRALAENLMTECAWLRISYWCFNRSAADDAAKKFPRRSDRAGVDVRTLHSALLAYVRRTTEIECPPRLAQTAEDLAAIVDERTSGALRGMAERRAALSRKRTSLDAERRELATLAWQTVGRFCRSADREFGEDTVPWGASREDEEIARFAGTGVPRTKASVLPFARVLWLASSTPTDDALPCTQEVMAKVALTRLRDNPSHELGWGYGEMAPHAIFVDEAQDLDDCSLALLEIQRRRGPSNVWQVGDPAQSIYQFRGASEKALEDTTLSGTARAEFRLTTSYRFADAIAQVANVTLFSKRWYDASFQYEPIVGAATAASEVHSWDETNFPTTPPLSIVCRSNKGILHAAARVLGVSPTDDATTRDANPVSFFFDLAGIAEKNGGGGGGFGALLDALDDAYAFFQGTRKPPRFDAFKTFSDLADAVVHAEDDDANKNNNNDEPVGASVEPVVKDAVRTVLTWRTRLPRLTRTIRTAAHKATKDPRAEKIKFTTVHKSKGLEWDRVLVYDDLAPLVAQDKNALVKFIPREEIHLWHVAVTRARTDLWLPPKFQALLEYHRVNRTRIPGGPPVEEDYEPPLPQPQENASPPAFRTCGQLLADEKNNCNNQRARAAPAAQLQKMPSISLKATMGLASKHAVRVPTINRSAWDAA